MRAGQKVELRRKRTKKTISAEGALQRVRLLWPMDPFKTNLDLVAALDEAMDDLADVVSDKTRPTPKRAADLALRVLQHDRSGMADYIGPALIQIARRYVSASSIAKQKSRR